MIKYYKCTQLWLYCLCHLKKDVLNKYALAPNMLIPFQCVNSKIILRCNMTTELSLNYDYCITQHSLHHIEESSSKIIIVSFSLSLFDFWRRPFIHSFSMMIFNSIDF